MPAIGYDKEETISYPNTQNLIPIRPYMMPIKIKIYTCMLMVMR